MHFGANKQNRTADLRELFILFLIIQKYAETSYFIAFYPKIHVVLFQIIANQYGKNLGIFLYFTYTNKS